MEKQNPGKQIRAIDIHHHYFPPRLIDEVKQHGKALGVELTEGEGKRITLTFAGGRRQSLEPGLTGVDARLSMMEKGRLAIAAVEANTGSLGYPLDGARGDSWCRLYNEGFRELVSKHPGRFLGLAAVPMQDPARAAKVLEDAILTLGLSGAMIATNANGKYYHEKEFEPFWGKAQELNVLVVMHPDNVPGAERMRAMRLLTVCGNPADTTLSLGYMVFGGLFDRFPNLQICVMHGGGFFPYHLGRFEKGFALDSRSGKVPAASSPKAYLKNLYFDTLVYRVETLEYLKRMVGASRMMLGTDYPYDLGDWMGVEKVEAMDCTESERESILHGNARRALKLPAGA